MSTSTVIRGLLCIAARGVNVGVDESGLYAKPPQLLTEADQKFLLAHKPELEQILGDSAIQPEREDSPPEAVPETASTFRECYPADLYDVDEARRFAHSVDDPIVREHLLLRAEQAERDRRGTG